MNREIKFRAWLRESEGFNDEGYKMIDDLAFEEYLPVNDQLASVKHLMQYTGLKDKVGKEIYEGDIIRGVHPFASSNLKATNAHVVIFKNGCFELNGSPLGWDTDELDEETGKIRPYNTRNWAYVHGNIYQNPELLETVQK